ncbi:CmcJ/NvfI family oxidoreductase [Sorangium sp. So ce1389]|uniref:CmcJ/NvfI family oxidoreductase n=1 Tax=Sorangium sp. So ce1389 TaxID=3133336 RepID=UPI003F638812
MTSVGSLPATLADPLAATSPRGSQGPAFKPSRRRVPFVRGTVGYLKPADARPVIHLVDTGPGVPREDFEHDLREVPIVDARLAPAPPRIHHEGFELWDAPSRLRNFHDEALQAVYYPECVELACLVTGASRGFVFDHLLRQREEGRPPLTFGRGGAGSAPAAAGRVHNDYSEDSGRRRLHLVLNDPEAAAAVRRYSIVNIWRSIGGVVRDTPLAVCDATSVNVGDLVPAELRYPRRVGEIYLSHHAPGHRWAYFSEMDTHEALVFKQFDSQASGTSRFTPHAAFDLPHIPSDAPLRRSIEVRCLVVYD